MLSIEVSIFYILVDINVDKEIPTDRAVYIVWAIGNVNNDMMVTKHKRRMTNSLYIDDILMIY